MNNSINSTSINSLHDEMLVHTFSFLPNPLKAAGVCKRWHRLSTNNAIYLQFLTEIFQAIGSEKSKPMKKLYNRLSGETRAFETFKRVWYTQNRIFKNLPESCVIPSSLLEPKRPSKRFCERVAWIEDQATRDLVNIFIPTLYKDEFITLFRYTIDHNKPLSDQKRHANEILHHLAPVITDTVTLYEHYDNLTFLPAAIDAFSKIEALTISYTNVFEIPPTIGNLSQLKTLYISHSPIQKLPKEVRKLVNLNDLTLGEEHFRLLPTTIKNAQDILKIRTSGPLDTLADRLNSLEKPTKEELSFALQDIEAVLPKTAKDAPTFFAAVQPTIDHPEQLKKMIHVEILKRLDHYYPPKSEKRELLRWHIWDLHGQPGESEFGENHEMDDLGVLNEALNRLQNK